MKKKFYEQSLGARFAVKEAILKATDSHIFEFKLSDIETINSKTGKPSINIFCNKLDLKIKNALKNLEKKYFWINNGYSCSKSLDWKYFLNEAKNEVKKGINKDEILNLATIKNIKRDKTKLIKQL